MHFVVKVNNSLTGVHAIESEVPQGSVLGPVLYTLYTSHIPLLVSTYTGTLTLESASKNKTSKEVIVA